MNARPAFLSPLLFAAMATALGSPAQAQNSEQKLACIDAHEAGQALRQDGQWRDARAKFLECAAEACPSPVRRECAPWAKELEASIPTLLVYVDDAAGKPLPAASVSIDFEPRAAAVTATPVDPGTHVVQAHLDGYVSAERTVVLREADRQVVTITLTALPPEPRASTVARPRVPPSPPKRSNLPAFIALGAAGVAATSFAVFGIFGRHLESTYAASCAPDCNEGDRSAVKFHYAMADISLGTAVVAAGVAIVLFVTQQHANPSRTSSR